MIKTSKYLSGFSGGVDADTSTTKRDATHYLDSDNLRIISNDEMSSGSLTSVAGNDLRLSFPTGDVIIGTCKIRSNLVANTDAVNKDAIIFFVKNTVSSLSKIYQFEGDIYLVGEIVDMTSAFASHTYNSTYAYKSGLLYSNASLNFSVDHPIKAEGRYESTNIRKVYWVDGLNNIRYMNLDSIVQGDPVTIFDINPTAILPMPTTSVVSGGSYTTGLVQHAYQLYIKNGAATTYSPLSPALSLINLGGGRDSRDIASNILGSNTGRAVSVTINGLDPNYNRIRIVAIHYTEYLSDPIINIVGEAEYNSATFNMIDNGYTTYGTIPITEFRLFGQTSYIANSLAEKNNYLFFADMIEDKWNPDWLNPTYGTFWDSRAIRYINNSGITADIYDSTTLKTITVPSNKILPADWVTAGWTHPVTHDSINKFNDTSNDGIATQEFKYQSDGNTLGAEGPNVTVGFTNQEFMVDVTTANPIDGDISYSYITAGQYPSSPIGTTRKSSQRTDVYRMYIVFFNTKMQYSAPQWICDLRMPSNDDYRTVTLDAGGRRMGNYIYPTVTVRNLPSDTELYGWQIFRCERTSLDRSVMASGVISPCDSKTGFSGIDDPVCTPFSSITEPYCFCQVEDMPSTVNMNVLEIVSPEIAFNKNLTFIGGDKIRIEGRYLIEGYKSVTLSADDARSVMLTLANTYETHSADVLNYTVTDGSYMPPGIIHGDPPVYPSASLIGGATVMNILRYNYGLFKYHGNGASNFIAKVSQNLNLSNINWGIPYGSYIRNVFLTQYGGNTYEARSFNHVIPYSDITLKNTLTTTCYNGDTFITLFAYLRSSKPDIGYGDYVSFQQEMVYIPVESSINCFYRLDPIQKYYSINNDTYSLQETLTQGLVLQPTTYPLDLGDLYRYNAVYSRSADATLIQNTIFDSNNIEHSDVKVIATGKKINNEYFDNWTNLYTNNNIELDPKFGPIRNIFSFNNKLFTGQDKAIAIIAVNDRSLIQDNSALQLTLGTGGVLDRFDYLTTTSGFQNYYDMALSDKSFYYFDRRNKIDYTLTDKGDVPISEINGYRSVLKRFATISTVRCGYDPIYKEVFLYISDGTIKKNSIFNEYTNSFNGKHTFEPDLMFNLNDQMYSTKGNEVYLHNYGDYGKFYGTVYDSSITDIINPNGIGINTFDVLELRIDVIDTDGTTYLPNEQFDTIEISNSHQSTTKTISFSGDDSVEDTSKSLAKKWRTWLLPDDSSTDFYRFVDSFIKIKMVRNNDSNKKLILHDLVTYLRPVKN